MRCKIDVQALFGNWIVNEDAIAEGLAPAEIPASEDGQDAHGGNRAEHQIRIAEAADDANDHGFQLEFEDPGPGPEAR